MDEKPDCLNDLDKVRHIEGFPLGTDEDICALSDPPYYTAYPNPYLEQFVAEYGVPYHEHTDDYNREPAVSDVTEGKNGVIYIAHTYHTKVPHQAIRSFIEHYTKSGDIVFDGFSGTGMTGIAAQELGRRAILCDLSPSATHISYNYNRRADVALLKEISNKILKEVSKECSWMFETQHSDGSVGKINYVIWSDVFRCPYCQIEVVYWENAIDHYRGEVYETFLCPKCQAELSKDRLNRVVVSIQDHALGCELETVKRVPVLINYSQGRKRFDKTPDTQDLEKVSAIQDSEIPYWYPSPPIMFKGSEWGDSWRSGYHTGITHAHHFYTKRNLWVLSTFWNHINNADERIRHELQWAFTGILQRSSIMHQLAITRIAKDKKQMGGKTAGHRRGTLYIPSLQVEMSAIDQYQLRTKGVVSALRQLSMSNQPMGHRVTTQSTTDLSQLGSSCIDYIFTDPPFGENIMYSELNFMWEAWLQVFSNNKAEAIMNRSQGKELVDYRNLMIKSFREMYRVLKPGRWITVVFHNSRADVWNAIQEGLAQAGFLVAQVTILDKKKKTHTQVTAPGSVKNDLVINAYKPRRKFAEEFLQKVGVGMERAFIKQHLGYLPIAANVERSREMLYSKMLAYYIQRGYEISLNSAQFYSLLAAEFVERDGYWFRDEAQAQEYEQRKLDPARRKAAGKGQGVLFISDERSAIAWLHHFLAAGPQTYSDLYTAYAKALQTSDDQIPELKQLLEETCVQVNGHWKRPDTLTAEELETRRRERLLRQFNDYLREAEAGRKLKDVRKEAILTGFEEAYRAKRYQDIIMVGGKLNQSLIDSSTEIFDFIDIAEAKVV